MVVNRGLVRPSASRWIVPRLSLVGVARAIRVDWPSISTSTSLWESSSSVALSRRISWSSASRANRDSSSKGMVCSPGGGSGRRAKVASPLLGEILQEGGQGRRCDHPEAANGSPFHGRGQLLLDEGTSLLPLI